MAINLENMKTTFYKLLFTLSIILMGCEKTEQDSALDPNDIVGKYCGTTSYGGSFNPEISLIENKNAVFLDYFVPRKYEGMELLIVKDSLIIQPRIDTFPCYYHEDCIGTQLEFRLSGSGTFNSIEQRIDFKYRIEEYFIPSGELLWINDYTFNIKKKSIRNYVGSYAGIEENRNITLNIYEDLNNTSFLFDLRTNTNEKYLFENTFKGQLINNGCRVKVNSQIFIEIETQDSVIINGSIESFFNYSNAYDEVLCLDLWKENSPNSWSPYFEFYGIKKEE